MYKVIKILEIVPRQLCSIADDLPELLDVEVLDVAETATKHYFLAPISRLKKKTIQFVKLVFLLFFTLKSIN